jgi:hypothetical protein
MAVQIKDPAIAASEIPVTVSKATTTTLEGTLPLKIDGESFPIGARLLIKNQTAEAQNGLYGLTKSESLGGDGTLGGEGTLGTGSNWLLTRTADADTTAEVERGMLVPVEGGSLFPRTLWAMMGEDPIEVGVDPQPFMELFASPGGLADGDLEGSYPEPAVIAGGTNEFT